jgi:hypothetical protein
MRTGLPADSDAGWLNLSEIATVEVTSEDERFPIEIGLAHSPARQTDDPDHFR